ncbi:hypothetical protein D3C78_1424660 [compost metagenome]
MQFQLGFRRVAEELPGQLRCLAARAAVIEQLLLAGQFTARHVEGQLPVATAIGQSGHPGPAVFQAFHRAGDGAWLALPAVQQTEGFRAAQGLALPGVQRRLTAAGFDEEIRLQLRAAVEAYAMPFCRRLHG